MHKIKCALRENILNLSHAYWCAVTAILCGGQCGEDDALAHRSQVCLLSLLGYERLDSVKEKDKRAHLGYIWRKHYQTH